MASEFDASESKILRIVQQNRISKIYLDWESWCSGDGEKLFQLMEYFDHLIRISSLQFSSEIKQLDEVRDVIYKNMSRLSAEGVNIRNNIPTRIIRNFAEHWIKHRAIPVELPVLRKSFLSIEDKTLILGGLGKFDFENKRPPVNIVGLNRGRMNIEKAIIFRKNNSIIVDLYIAHTVKGNKSDTEYPVLTGTYTFSEKEKIISSGEPFKEEKNKKPNSLAESLFSFLEKDREMVDKIARAITLTDYKSLSGRPTSGGLPTLGKNAR